MTEINDEVGLELFKKIIERELKNGKNPWLIFTPIDTNFITEHFGSLAASYALEQRNNDSK